MHIVDNCPEMNKQTFVMVIATGFKSIPFLVLTKSGSKIGIKI